MASVGAHNGIPFVSNDATDVVDIANGVWLAERLVACSAAFMEGAGVTPEGWRGKPLAAQEVSYLRRAINEGFAAIDDQHGVLVIDGFHTPKGYRLFQSYEGGRGRPGKVWSWSWRESFTQLAFACELVVDHRWAPRNVALEVGAHDIAAGTLPVSHPLLLAEAKVDLKGQSGLEGMLAVFTEMAGGPPAKVGSKIRENASRKYFDLVRWRPAVFAAIAPGVRLAFDVEHSADRATLRPRAASVSPADIGPPST